MGHWLVQWQNNEVCYSLGLRNSVDESSSFSMSCFPSHCCIWCSCSPGLFPSLPRENHMTHSSLTWIYGRGLEKICSFLKNKWRFKIGNCHGWAHSGRWRLSLFSLFHIYLLITDKTKNSHWHWTATCAGHLMYIISKLHHHSAARHHCPLSQTGILSLRTSMICQIPHH